MIPKLNRELELKRIKLLLETRKQAADVILDDIKILSNDKRKAQSGYEENKIQRIIDDKIKAHKLIESETIKLENELEQTDFPEKLFNYFVKFDYLSQRKAYGNYLKKAKANRIGSFVIHSEGNYENLHDQEWFWKCILLSYLKKPNKEVLKPFFKKALYTFRHLFYHFQLSVNPEYYENKDDVMDENVSIEEIEDLVPHLLEKLKTKNIIVPIYLSKYWASYQFIYPFFEQVWQPLCQLLATSVKFGIKWH